MPVAAAAIGAVAGFGGARITSRGTLARERSPVQLRKAEAYIELLANMNLRYEAVSSLIPFRPRHGE